MSFKKYTVKDFIKRQKSLVGSVYLKNFLILFSGNTISQLIPILTSFILSRVFSPLEFGVFAQFSAISFILMVFMLLRYDLAILLPKTDKEAINVVALCLIICIVLTIFISLLLVIIPDTFFESIGYGNMLSLKWFLPLNLFVIALSVIMTQWVVRKQKFFLYSYARIFKSFGSVFINLFYAWKKINFYNKDYKTIFTKETSGFLSTQKTEYGDKGLVYGFIAGQLLLFTVTFGFIYKSLRKLWKYVNYKTIKEMFLRYNDFLKVNVFHAFSDLIGSSVLFIVIGIIFSDYILGLYSFAWRMVMAPLGLVSNSFGEVCYQKISERSAKEEPFLDIFLQTLKIMLAIGIPAMVVLIFFGKQLFGFMFGPEWQEAGVYAAISAPCFIMMFIATPLTNIAIVMDKQPKNFLLSFARNISIVVSVVIGKYVFNDIKKGLMLFSVLVSLQYIYLLFWYYSLSKKSFSEQKIKNNDSRIS